MGWDRGGWYSWDLLDNAGRRSAEEVHSEWQDLALGDQLKFSGTRPRLGRAPGCRRRTKQIPWPLWVHRSERALARSKGATAVLTHGGSVGLPAQRASRWAHSPCDKCEPNVPSSMGREVRRVVASDRGFLAHAGPDDGGAQAEHRALTTGTVDGCIASPSDCLHQHEKNGPPQGAARSLALGQELSRRITEAPPKEAHGNSLHRS